MPSLSQFSFLISHESRTWWPSIAVVSLCHVFKNSENQFCLVVTVPLICVSSSFVHLYSQANLKHYHEIDIYYVTDSSDLEAQLGLQAEVVSCLASLFVECVL